MEKKFTTVINCMDGRIQAAVIDFMQKKYNSLYVDNITAAGPCKLLAENKKEKIVKDILFRTGVSVEKHNSESIAVVGHHDCAMIKDDEEYQKSLVGEAVAFLKARFDVEVIGLWVNHEWKVEQM